MGRQTAMTDARGQATLMAYDALGRQTGRTLPLGMSETYAYNAAGERTEHVDFNGRHTTYTYDGRGRLLTTVPDPVLTEPTISFTYTATGQRATMTDGTGSTTYAYDDRDRLTQKVTRALISQTLVPGGPITSFYGYDGSGSVRYLTDAQGAITDTYDYDAFGNLIASSGATPNQHLYDAEQFEAAFGLYYLRARYYNPDSGRFVSMDPLPSINPYPYVSNNPLNLTDPTGAVAILERAFLEKVVVGLAVAHVLANARVYYDYSLGQHNCVVRFAPPITYDFPLPILYGFDLIAWNCDG
jgi:RHS repeat-associated protein